jgi:hypothetical protein
MSPHLKRLNEGYEHAQTQHLPIRHRGHMASHEAGNRARPAPDGGPNTNKKELPLAGLVQSSMCCYEGKET